MDASLKLRSASLSWNEGQLCFLRNDGRLGWRDLSFSFAVDGEPFDSRALAWWALPAAPQRLTLVARPGNGPVELTVRAEVDSENNVLRLRCVYRNRTTRPVRLCDIREGAGRLLCPGGRVFHVENARKMHIAALDTPFPDRRRAWGTALFGDSFWADLGAPLQYGRSEDQPYPGLFYVSPELGCGLVESTLTQDRWYRETCIGAAGQGPGFAYEGLAATRGVAAVTLLPDSAVQGEEVFLQIVDHTDLMQAFDTYHAQLEARYAFRSATSPNREELIWGSWNFGIWANCSHPLVVENACLVKEHFERVRWIQIDDGWTAVGGGGVGALLQEGVDREKFPQGLEAVAGAIRAVGLRPAIWCGMLVSAEAELVRRRPDLLLRRRDGAFHCWGKYVLDPSLAEVRELLVRSYRTLVRDWGFEGVKLDFWTYGFEDQGIAYGDESRTSLELRTWWLSTLRDILPEDGYLQSGCNIWNGSPFVSRFFDNNRYGIDIGIGEDRQALYDTVTCLANLSPIPAGRFWLPNSDAIGAMKGASPEMRRTLYSFCLVTQSALELGGDLRQEVPPDWDDALRVLEAVRIGAPFHPLDFGRPDEPIVPTLWFASQEEGGLLCAFNWDGRGPSRRLVALSEIGLEGGPVRATDIWRGDASRFEGGAIHLPPVPAGDVWAVELRPERDVGVAEERSREWQV